MIIGVDFDNTIVCHDKLFYKYALKAKLIPKSLTPIKNMIRDYLRKRGQEDKWTRLQGLVYGSKALQAASYPDALEFFKYCKNHDITVYIISHKTKQPILGNQKDSFDLHKLGHEWLKKNKYYSKDTGLTTSKVFFELTKESKISRIKELHCTHFIDDLQEFLEEKSFPDIKKILFDPNNACTESTIDIAKNWPEVQKKIEDERVKNIMNDRQAYLKSQDFINDIKILLNIDELLLNPIIGGRNNKAFKVSTKKGNYLAKVYFSHPNDKRDRLNNEYNFLEYASKSGVRNIPKPIARNNDLKIAIYSFIEGRKIMPTDIDDDAVKSAMQFYAAINKNKEKAKLNNASESCFSMQEHIDRIGFRVDRLKNIVQTDKIDIQAIILTAKIRDSWKKIVKKSQELMKTYHIDANQTLDIKEQCISPSDFGYHNALLDKKIYFIDFEYAGLDDPAKLVCDFFCQPDLPVSMKYYEEFKKEIFKNIPYKEHHMNRTDILLPMYKIKWCCIMLNEFLKTDSDRRKFSGTQDKEKQLAKAERYFEKIKY